MLGVKRNTIFCENSRLLNSLTTQDTIEFVYIPLATIGPTSVPALAHATPLWLAARNLY